VTSITPTGTDSARRVRLSGPERREQLLDVTKEIAFASGFHAVSIEAVAREAGISRPVVYTHFEDLAGLLAALIDRESERALSQLAAVLPKELDASDPSDQLLAALGGYLEAVQSDPLTWRLVLMPPEGAPEALRERIAIGRSAVVALLAKLVGRGFGSVGPSPDPEMTARTFSALADEGARLVLTDPDHFSAERIVEHARWLLTQIG
jgi:AcrR family transcriptional regulator